MVSPSGFVSESPRKIRLVATVYAQYWVTHTSYLLHWMPLEPPDPTARTKRRERRGHLPVVPQTHMFIITPHCYEMWSERMELDGTDAH